MHMYAGRILTSNHLAAEHRHIAICRLCGDALVNMAAAVLTPTLCVIGGWRYACYFYAASCAVATLVWQLAARSRPITTTQSPRKPAEGNGAKSETHQKTVEWAIFRLAPVQALIMFWVSAGYSSMNLTQLAPLCFNRRFGLSPVEAGRCIATAMTVNIPGNLLTVSGCGHDRG